MNFEPQKFFIGVIDFFSVLMPGALLTYSFLPKLLSFVPENAPTSGAAGPILFFFSSYLIGHFVFLAGSWLLDDKVYDPLRSAVTGARIGRLAEGKRLAPSWLTRLAAGFGLKEASEALAQVKRIRQRDLARFGPVPAMNAFQWAKARLAIDLPGPLEIVQRFEADSKFFRSLVIVLPLVAAAWLRAGYWDRAAVAVLLLWPTVWRYVDQRNKAVNQAYWFVIAHESRRDDGFRSETTLPENLPTHAGGVVYRSAKGTTEFLLVKARRGDEKVLPKGHIEHGESSAETAVREVREESGVWARIVCPLRVASYEAGEPVRVQYFLMERLDEGEPLERDRSHWWMPLDVALSAASHELTRSTLRLAVAQLEERASSVV